MDWRTYSYLQDGSPRQRAAYDTLQALDVFSVLQPFDPALVSTVCVGLDVPGSDLDIIGERTSAAAFPSVVREAYGREPNFQIWARRDGATVARFDTGSFPVEIFVTDQPVEQQYAWRHLSLMARLLKIEPRLRAPVRALKRDGHATEEAFAALLGLDGDPYEAFLTLEPLPDQQVAALCHEAV